MKFLKNGIVIFLMISIMCSAVACGSDVKKEEPFILNTDGMTEEQKAIVITAESYYLRGNYAQYDMSTLTKGEYYSEIERRQVGKKSPEDYTEQNVGYTDCSGFVFDVYKYALDYDFLGSLAWTKAYCNLTKDVIIKEFPIEENFAELSESELKVKEDEFKSALQAGDIIVYRYAGDTAGHAMLYVGNGMMIHSGGASYDYKTATEAYEENGTYLYEPIADSLLVKGHRRYLFDKHQYVVIRPLDSFNGEIPEATKMRMDIMRGIKAEKLCSHTYGQTVNAGDEMTFTFRITNYSDKKKTLTVTDEKPLFVDYVSGAEKFENNTISWKVKLASGETKEVSYKVKVKTGDRVQGYTVVSESNICGVPVNCPEVKIANTLTAKQQNDIKTAVKELAEKDLKDVALANAIYNKACGKNAFEQKSVEEIWENVIDPWAYNYVLGEEGALFDAIAPCLYGGRKMGETVTGSKRATNRTRMVGAKLLVVGDVVLFDEQMYIFTGDELVSLDGKKSENIEFLDTLITAERFVVLRPSIKF